MIRYTEPTVNPVNCGQVNGDSTPNSRHTYGGLEYIAHADRFFASGGALNCNSGGCGADKTWTFDFDTRKWTDRLPSGARPPTGCGNTCAYDPNSKRVFWGDNNYSGNGAGMYSYSFDDNSWTKRSSTGFYNGAAVVDPKRRLLFFIGGEGGGVTVFDIGKSDYTPQVWTTTGGSSFLGNSEPGLAYDPVADKIVGWVGGSVYALDPDTRVWTAYTPSGAPDTGAAGQSTGINGRWRYVPSLNAYIVVSSIDDNVYFYKLTAGGGATTRSVEQFHQRIVSTHPENFRLYDLRGRMAGTFLRGNQKPVWETARITKGVYLVQTIQGNNRIVDKVMFVDK